MTTKTVIEAVADCLKPIFRLEPDRDRLKRLVRPDYEEDLLAVVSSCECGSGVPCEDQLMGGKNAILSVLLEGEEYSGEKTNPTTAILD